MACGYKYLVIDTHKSSSLRRPDYSVSYPLEVFSHLFIILCSNFYLFFSYFIKFSISIKIFFSMKIYEFQFCSLRRSIVIIDSLFSLITMGMSCTKKRREIDPMELIGHAVSKKSVLIHGSSHFLRVPQFFFPILVKF